MGSNFNQCYGLQGQEDFLAVLSAALSFAIVTGVGKKLGEHALF